MDSHPTSSDGITARPMNVTCPFCQVALAVPPSRAGEALNCPQCDGRFRIPMPTVSHGLYETADQDDYGLPDYQSFVGKKIPAGICALFFGGLGIHKFVLGLNSGGVLMLMLTLGGLVTGVCLIVPLFVCMLMNVIGLIEGVLYLTKSDDDFYRSYAVQKRQWL